MTALSLLLRQTPGPFDRLHGTNAEPTLTRRAIDAVAGVSGRSVNPEDIAVVEERTKASIRAGQADTIGNRDLREVCQAFLQSPQSCGRDPDVAKVVIAQALKRQRRAPFNALINAYLDAFATSDRDIERLAASLQTVTPQWPWRDGDPWPTRAKTFSLFEPAIAPQRIADAVLGEDQFIPHILERAGLDTEARRTGGLAEAAFRAACERTGALQGPAALPLQSRLMEWAAITQTALAYPGAWPAFAEALLEPWSRNRIEPPQAHRQLLIEKLVAYARDPRVEPLRWKAVPNAYKVMVEWLTQVSVELFFDIVSETVTEGATMWAERRAFWTRYLKAGHISAAWVAFCADGASRADRAARRLNNTALSMFGRCGSGNGKGAEHAALIMKIGDVTVVDWSHNGSWNIWAPGSKGAPQLFRHNLFGQIDYQPRQLMYAPEHGAHHGRWQETVRTILHNHTGLRP